jgi:Transcription factor Tfb4
VRPRVTEFHAFHDPAVKGQCFEVVMRRDACVTSCVNCCVQRLGSEWACLRGSVVSLVLPECSSRYAEQAKRDAPASGQAGSMSAALSQALCMLSRRVSKGGGSSSAENSQRIGVRPRILVIQTSLDVPGQYIACMNAIFSAQRLGATIDAAAVTRRTSTFLEQVWW